MFFIYITVIFHSLLAFVCQKLTCVLCVMTTVVVSHNCVQARIISANITAENGVVYMVDNLFGFIYNDLYTEMKRDLASLR